MENINVDAFCSAMEAEVGTLIEKLKAGNFHRPQINTFQIPQPYPEQSSSMVTSKYLANNYYIDFDPAWWRAAIDRAQLYSDLSYIDAMYSWCVQSSPFLVSLMDKRMRPFLKNKFVIKKPNGEVWQEITDFVTKAEWFTDMKRAMLLSLFYGVQIISIDIANENSVNYPIRNIDIFNKGLREGTFQYESIVNVNEYDNMFYFQPFKEQDFKLGLLQQVSRVMISMIKAGNDWQMANENYAYPMKVIEYSNDNDEAKAVAFELAKSPSPAVIPVTSFTATLDKRDVVPNLNIRPVNTQMYPEAFRSFKEIMDKYESYIMQLILGGTLLGATEKNTNSEQLAEIHLGLFDEILEGDNEIAIRLLNEQVIVKLSRLLGIPQLAYCTFEKLPDQSIDIRKFKVVGDVIAKMGMRFRPEILTKVGMEPNDIDTSVQNNSWSPLEKWISKITSSKNNKK